MRHVREAIGIGVREGRYTRRQGVQMRAALLLPRVRAFVLAYAEGPDFEGWQDFLSWFLPFLLEFIRTIISIGDE